MTGPYHSPMPRKPVPVDFRKLVADRMAALGLDQSRLAEASGVSRPTLNRYLGGHNDIAAEKLAALLLALGVRVVAGRAPGV